MSIEASSDPATPVFTTPRTAKRSMISCVWAAAFTMPTSHCATTTGAPDKVPVKNESCPVWEVSTAPSAAMLSFSSSTSTSIAPMMPIGFSIDVS